MTLVVYPGADGAASVYEDDGKTFDYRRGEWMRIELSRRDSERRLGLRLARGSRMLPPARRAVEVRVAGEKASRSLVFDGRPLNVSL